jgi:hypothetical protein
LFVISATFSASTEIFSGQRHHAGGGDSIVSVQQSLPGASRPEQL